ncbi:hypothetical protein AB0N73_11675 [Microbacterium sp. NPDC089189]|uniref:hypothetical protein n=1 Tax=Microbacterium sp. NPDC089189 TaxID=3154972 RepID=UPI003422E968
MTSLWSLISAPARGQRRWQAVVVLVLVVLTPLLVVITLVPTDDERPPVALVNLDEIVTTSTPPVAAGKLLTENLITEVTSVDWMLTDPATASSSLASGDVLAVVTIPADFSANVLTMGTAAPTQAALRVETSTQHGFVGGIVAEALSASLPAGVSAQLTQQFVSGSLTAFADLGDGIAQASSAASQIGAGVAGAGAGAAELQTLTEALAGGLRAMDGVLAEMPAGARGLGELTAAGAVASGELSVRLLERSLASDALVLAQAVQSQRLSELEAYLAAPDPDPAVVAARLTELRTGADEVAAALAAQATALGSDAETAAAVALGAGAISAISGPVADGLGEFATALGSVADGADRLAGVNGQLADGLGLLAGGTDDLAAGLDQAQSSIPRYDTDQLQQIASVVARPIGVDASSTGGPSSALASSLATFGPVALWLGAIGVFLALRPFARSALTSAASATRVARSAALVILPLALVQAVPVWAVVAASGVAPERALVAAGLAAVTALSFALVHQALLAFLPRAGLVVSLLLLGIQVIAAGTVTSPGTTPSAAGPLGGLPLSLALQGAQALVGGSLHELLNAAIGLVLWAAVGALGTVLAIRRARSRALAATVLARP